MRNLSVVYITIISVLRKLRQEDHKFKSIQCYISRTHLNKQKGQNVKLNNVRMCMKFLVLNKVISVTIGCMFCFPSLISTHMCSKCLARCLSVNVH